MNHASERARDPDSAYRTAIGRVAVIGTGVIGASWVSQFLSCGLDVVATDPAPGAEAALRETVARHWPVLEQIGLSPGASPERLTFVAGPEEAPPRDFVQENGPERLEIKHETYRRLDAAAAPDVVLATSSSGLTPSAIQAACRHPGRVVLGHPFNPPHLVPLVEVLGGEHTDEGAVAAAMGFYEGIGKRPIRLRRELVGHVANRLQAALWREAFHLVGTGAATVADIDAAIAHGPGLRWALMGPCLLNHLRAGPRGSPHPRPSGPPDGGDVGRSRRPAPDARAEGDPRPGPRRSPRGPRPRRDGGAARPAPRRPRPAEARGAGPAVTQPNNPGRTTWPR